MSRRQRLGFGGSGASFDSHFCASIFQDDIELSVTSPRWQRNNLNGSISSKQLQDLHESFHWLQHILTGSGYFANRIRAVRDRMLVEEISNFTEWEAKARSKIRLGRGERFIDYDYQLNQLKLGLPSKHQSVHFQFVEDCYYLREFVVERQQHHSLIALAMYILTGELGKKFDNEKATAFLQEYSELSSRGLMPRVDDRFVATEDLMESQAILMEQFYLRHFETHEIRMERIKSLSQSTYMTAHHFFYDVLFGEDEVGAHKLIKDRGSDLELTMFLCLDVALDIYLPYSESVTGYSDFDCYPPIRYSSLVQAVQKLGLYEHKLEHDVSRITHRKLSDYKNALKQEANLRTSSDAEFFYAGPRYHHFEKLTVPHTPVELGPFEFNLPIYSVVSEIQGFLFHLRKYTNRHDICDPILNLSGNYAPYFTMLFDQNEPAVEYLGKPPLILYRNGLVGLNQQLPLVARQFLRSGLRSYGLFSLAFDDGPVVLCPIALKKDINLNGDYPTDIFEQGLFDSAVS